MKQEVWIGLVSVAEPPGGRALGGAEAAFVNALASASCIEEFQDSVSRAVEELNLIFIEIIEAEPFSRRVSRYQLAGELDDMAQEVKTYGTVRFGDFYAYPKRADA